MAEETTTHKHTHKEQRRQYTFNKLKAFGQEIIGDVEKEKVPTLRIPSRGTGNIVYDPDKRYYILGDRFGKRSLGNVKQIRGIKRQNCNYQGNVLYLWRLGYWIQ